MKTSLVMAVAVAVSIGVSAPSLTAQQLGYVRGRGDSACSSPR